MQDRLILTPFNGVFIVTFLIMTGLFVLAVVLLRKKDLRTRGVALAAIMLANFAFYWYYKAMLSMDTAYSVICEEAGKGAFTWWVELPFHLCNVNMILIPVAAVTRWRPVCSFCFFLAPLGAFMAIIMPGIGFSGYSIFLPRMLGYYITHWVIFFGGVALAALGIYRPRFRDFPVALLTTFGVALFAFCVSELLRATHLADHANYFFTVESEGNAVLDLCHKFVPLPFLYLIPCCLILLPYMCLVTVGFWLYDRRHPAAT